LDGPGLPRHNRYNQPGTSGGPGHGADTSEGEGSAEEVTMEAGFHGAQVNGVVDGDATIGRKHKRRFKVELSVLIVFHPLPSFCPFSPSTSVSLACFLHQSPTLSDFLMSFVRYPSTSTSFCLLFMVQYVVNLVVS